MSSLPDSCRSFPSCPSLAMECCSVVCVAPAPTKLPAAWKRGRFVSTGAPPTVGDILVQVVSSFPPELRLDLYEFNLQRIEISRSWRWGATTCIFLMVMTLMRRVLAAPQRNWICLCQTQEASRLDAHLHRKPATLSEFGELESAKQARERLIPAAMENGSDEECISDSGEISTTQSGVEEMVETFHSYQMSRSKFQSTVVVRKYESKGLSFQLWPAASAVCWYLEKEFGEGGMCLPASASDEDILLVVPSDTTSDMLKESVHLAEVVEDIRSSRPVSGNYYRPSEQRRMKVLELGSGTGMVGIVAACLGAHVILTDLPHVLPNAEFNMELNRVVIQAAGGFVESHVLRWGVEEDVKSLGSLSSFDLILASDVVYYDTLFKPLLQTLKWLVGAADGSVASDKRKNQEINGVKTRTGSAQVCVSVHSKSTPLCSPEKNEDDLEAVHKRASFSPTAERGKENVPLNNKEAKTPVIYIGHMRRWKKDSHFFKQASKFFDVQVIHRHPPEHNARVGPIIYRLSSKLNSSTHSSTP